MQLEQVVPHTTIEGNEYLIKFEIVDPDVLPNVIGIPIPIINLTLVQVRRVRHNNPKFLNFLAQYISDYLNQFDVILYYYCDHADIEMRKSRSMSPQQYRYQFFNIIYETIPNNSLISLPIIIDDEINGNHYISIISSQKNSAELDKLYGSIESMKYK